MLFDNRVLLQGFVVKTIIWKLLSHVWLSCCWCQGSCCFCFPHSSSWTGWPSVLVECTTQCYHGVAEREEEAGQLSHYTQSADAIFGHVTITCLATSADSVAVMLAKVAATSLDSVLQWCWVVSQHSRHVGAIVFTLAGGPITRQ